MHYFYAECQSVVKDTIPITDSLSKNFEKVIVDSASIPAAREIKISKDVITTQIKYAAVDSNYTDIENKVIHLYGKATVDYEKMKIKAEYIRFNFGKDVVSAFDKIDSLHKSKIRPSFEDGETKVGFEEMSYNFKTKKAFITNMNSAQGEFFVTGDKAKYVSKESDSLSIEDKIYQEGAIISTCNHIPAHFGIRTRKMKMIPNKIAVMGPAQLEIAGIPTPLVLPFGFFPLIKGRSSGLIFPSNYTYDPNLGFGLQGIGYYFPVNDYLDVKVLGTIWTRGTFNIAGNANYKKIYKYSGNVDINFSNNRIEDANAKVSSNKSFGIRLSHNQDSKAHPYRNIGGSINIETNKNSQRVNYDYQNQANNKLYSNFNYSYRWPESPFSFRAALAHNQDNRTRVVNITLPDASLNMNTIQPFKRKNVSGDPLWYENISLNYKAGLKNYVKTSDTTLFTKATLDNLETGFNHGTSLSTNARLLNYINVSPSMNYEETYFLKTIEKTFDPTTLYDTIKKVGSDGDTIVTQRARKYGTVNQNLIRDFNVMRKFNMGINLNTQLFFTKRFRKGYVRGFRHVLKPNIGFNYSPDTDMRYRRSVAVDNRNLDSFEYYNPFATGAFSQSLNQKQMAINYGFTNLFEIKTRSRKDTVDKKQVLFNNISINGSYNFAADSFQWSDLIISGNTTVFKGLTNFQVNATLTPYEVNFASGRRLQKMLIDRQGDKQLLQLLSLRGSFNTNLTFKQIKGIFEGKNVKDELQNNNQDRNQNKRPSFSSIFDNLNINHSMNFAFEKNKSGIDTFFINQHNIYISGTIPMTKNWSFTSSGISYDLIQKKLQYPNIGFQRDLHCWIMRFSWQPQQGVYSMFIGVKPGPLNFLKYDYNQPFISR